MQAIDDELGYDADHDDHSQYCIHGTWIGSWWGPDYLCQWCEDGYTVEQMRQAQIEAALWRAGQHLKQGENLVNVVTQAMADYPFNAALATTMTNIIQRDAKYDEAWRLRHLVSA